MPAMRALGWAILLALGAALPVRAQQPQQPQQVEHFLWLGAGAALLGALAHDARIHEEVHLERSEDLAPLARVGTWVGTPRVFLTGLGALYGAGRIAGQPALSRGAARAAAALAASGVVNGTLKFVLGRCRPDRGCASGELRMFNPDDGWQSFPSGHVVIAFSLASTLARETDSPWIGAAAYGLAGMVGWSRVYRGRHWASDVVGGAVVGTAASHFMLDYLDRRAARAAGPRIGLAPDGVAISVPVR